MADVEKTVEIIFGGLDRVSPVTEGIGGSVGKLGGGFSGISDLLDNIGEKVIRFNEVIVTTGVALAGLAIEQAGKFQEGFQPIGILLQNTGANAEQFAQSILDFGRDSTKSLDDISASVAQAMRAGTSYADSLGLVHDAETLAESTHTGLADATKLLTTVINDYGLTAKDTAGIADVLFTGATHGIGSFDSLTESFGKVLGIAAAAKVPLTDITAALATLSASGVTGEQAVSALNQILNKIITPTKAAQDYSENLGFAFGAQALAADGLQKTLQTVVTATNGNIDAMAQFFGGVRTVNGAVILANDTAGIYSGTLAAMADSMGKSAEAAEIVEKGFEQTNQNLLNNMKATLIEAGIPLLDQYHNTATALGEVFQGLSFGLQSGAFDPIINAINLFGFEAEGLFRGIAEALPAALALVNFQGLADAFTGLSVSFGKLFGNLDLTKPEDLAKAIQFLSDSIETIVRVGGGMVEALKEPFSWLVSFIDKINSGSTDAKEFAGQILTWNSIISAVVPGIKEAGAGLTEMGHGMEALAAARVLGLTGLSLDLGAIATAAGGAAAVIGAAGLVAAAVAAGVGIGTLADHTFDLSGKLANLLERMFPFKTGMDDASAASDHFREKVSALDEVLTLSDSALRSGAEAFGVYGASEDGLTKGFDAMLTAWTAAMGVTTSLKDTFAAAGKVWDTSTGQIIGITNSTYDLSAKTQIAERAGAKYFETMVNGVPTFIQVGKAHVDLKAKIDDTSDSTDKATKASNDFLAKMEQIASNERIKLIEATVKLDIAEVEANAKKVVAAFDSIKTGIDSTGKVMDSLSSNFTKFESSGNVRLWQDLMDKEEQRRDKEFALQQQLTDAQIDALKAKTDALNRGDALIKIDGSGLEPELEAFMFKILERIQVRANAELTEYLLGVAA